MAEIDFTVFGGGGFVGGQIVRLLQDAGYSVNVPNREAIAERRYSGRNLGHVIYAIGLTAGFRSRISDTVDAHVCLLKNLVEETRWRSWLYLSSTRIYGNSLTDAPRNEGEPVTVIPSLDSVYDLSKLLGEALCLSRPEQNCRVARLSNAIGDNMPKDNFLAAVTRSAITDGEVIIKEAPESAKDYIMVDDAARQLIEISLHGKSRIYNVASGILTEHAQIGRMLRNTFGARVSFQPNAAARRLAVVDVARLRDDFGFKTPNIEEQILAFFQRRLATETTIMER